LSGSEKVLEIGSNIGRNSLIIASIIDNNNFLTLESDTTIFNQLNENKNINIFIFI
jgi:predicted O-methyltransferase YrrM